MNPDRVVFDSTERGILTITLDSPGNRNALSVALMTQLMDALRSSANDDAVRAIVLTAQGRVFCAGADLQEASGSGVTDSRGLAASLMKALMLHPKPVIARVNGHVRGGGMGIVAACDLAVASSDASFAYTEVRLGVVPAIAAVPVAARAVSRGILRYMLTGEVFGAEVAERIGLISDASGDLETTVESMVDALRANAPTAIAAVKSLFRDMRASGADDVDMAFDWATGVSESFFGSPDASEGITAFFEKRRPRWAL